MVKIGILNLQGDVSEHQTMTQQAALKRGLEAEVLKVKTATEVAACDGIIISGGESTVIGRLIKENGIDKVLKEKKIPVMGTCAGMVLLGRETDFQQPLLGLIPMKVKRNGFGRQKLSFEADLKLKSMETQYPGVFIRAPFAYEVGEGAVVLGQIQDKIIAVAYKNYLATAFHPELTEDTRIHEYFIEEVLNCVE
ncbi:MULTISPECIES: pyridoxal 5'-phosphate synthase glutaminase subunit PdxT [Methanobacterium]|uniref:Pyridoxal 5'-phosphate synthase subunit PdxT n=1 Tax=Methanobacterium formicicum TaxID=2162 RepID=A0A090I507_METFO|nr:MULTISPECIES: pyridoxal 5'-phosphate synthase glutaminase subunit PdxT [Methanobacterium]AIS31470.1 pyridoxine biosynthesis glutamine amidotransferase subunit PdxT [Methanobacterium formicicum]KUK74905.1 MAG: Glutamine amidotransferase subunit PdxT [Methanobacterium sp. 42_16]MBF4475702.1 pyridoxal 5'-phosphate synthase glutaminase subunit PdxT [Methanobacterium formicicum]MDD4810488.1 pyridoxal 5'-phosphate synthase glutaminase subunit PdxT [Methanobacterium formicicum]MDH2658433.1 pyridox